MERTLDYKITSEYEGIKISLFLRNMEYSMQNLVELKKMHESVILNGKWVHMNEKLKAGDILTIHINETEISKKIPPVEHHLNIVYEDEDIIVINKPANMPIHPSMDNYENSLANALAFYYMQQGKPFIFRCTNRLDKDTSGLTVVSKHMLSGNIMSTMTRDRLFEREYLAICKGILPVKEGTIDAPISRKEGSIIERCVDYENGERAVTHYKVVLENKGHSLIRLKLETGRTHQIRVHMSSIGFPLIGDHLYNPDMEHMTRQALHSSHISFKHPITKELMNFNAPLPEDFKWILDGVVSDI